MSSVSVPPSPQRGADGACDLLERLRAGDSTAFEELVRGHGPRMLAVARRFMGDEDEARDALQDAFVQVLRSIAGFSGRAQLGTWLHRVVVNACLMRLRKRRHTRHVSLACMGGELPAVPSSAASDPSERLLHEQRWRMVTRCLSRLPEGYRSVLVMRYLEERDTHETATLIGISRNAVKIRLHRARLACRAMLRECSGAGAWR